MDLCGKRNTSRIHKPQCLDEAAPHRCRACRCPCGPGTPPRAPPIGGPLARAVASAAPRRPGGTLTRKYVEQRLVQSMQP